MENASGLGGYSDGGYCTCIGLGGGATIKLCEFRVLLIYCVTQKSDCNPSQLLYKHSYETVLFFRRDTYTELMIILTSKVWRLRYPS